MIPGVGREVLNDTRQQDGQLPELIVLPDAVVVLAKNQKWTYCSSGMNVEVR